MRDIVKTLPQREVEKHFKFIEVLGKGAYGKCYEVERVVDGKHYALKQVDVQGLDGSLRQDMANEVRLLASVQHPNIVKLYEAFVDSGYLCLVMELLPSPDLSYRIREHRERRQLFPEDVIWSYFLQLGQGLRHLHRLKIMHRDVKPQNVLVSDEGVVKLCDLGIAKLVREDPALTSTIVGTPQFMSPEVWQRCPYSFGCDVWSLGCLLYEMATLQLPFQGTTMQQLRFQVLLGRLERIPSTYSDDLWLLIRSMLTAQPELRPSITELMTHYTVVERQHLLPPGAAEDPAEAAQERAILDTIKVPDELHLLNLQLPRANYPEGPGVLHHLHQDADEDDEVDYWAEESSPDYAFWLPPEEEGTWVSMAEWHQRRKGAAAAGQQQQQRQQVPEQEGAEGSGAATKPQGADHAAGKPCSSFKIVVNAASAPAAAGAAQQAHQSPAGAPTLTKSRCQPPASPALTSAVSSGPKNAKGPPKGQQADMEPIPVVLHPKYAAIVLAELRAIAALNAPASPLSPCSTSFTSTSGSAASTPTPPGRPPSPADQAAGCATLLHDPYTLAASLGMAQQQQQQGREQAEKEVAQKGSSEGDAATPPRQQRRSWFRLPGSPKGRRASAGGPSRAGVQPEVSSTSGAGACGSGPASQRGSHGAEPAVAGLGFPAAKPPKSAKRGLFKLLAKLVGARSPK